uniref:ABC transmembrane type-1 domain-containing protein n=1 Tax=Vitis vinifera TaxID=29760 RepID=F6H9X5_VITVI
MQNPNELYTSLVRLQQTDQPLKVMTSSTPTISLDLHNNNNDSTSLNSSIPNMRAGEEVVSSSYIPEMQEQTKTYYLCFVALSVFSLLVNLNQHYNFAVMRENLTKRERDGVFKDTELTKDAIVVRSLVGDRMSLLVQTLSVVIISGTMGLVISWRLVVVMIAVQPIMIISHYTRLVLLKSMSAKAIKAQEESSKLATKFVSNLRTITVFSFQARILKMLMIAQQGPLKESVRQAWIAGIDLGTSQSLLSGSWFTPPTATAVDISILRIRLNDQWLTMALMGGFARIGNNEIIVLVNDAEKGSDIEPQEAQQTLEITEANLRKIEGKRQIIEANLALRRART